MATRHFLLVSGPSGGGKSTFIQHLAEARLPAEITAELPAGCARWPVIEANNMLKDKVPMADVLASIGSSEGAILHYDIAYIHRFGLPGYASDPASSLFQLGDRLDVVFVKPAPESLSQQFLKRQEAHQRKKNLLSRLWGDKVRRPLRRALYRLRGREAVDTHTLYLTEDWLRGCYAAWHDYVFGLIKDRPVAKILEIEPARQGDGTAGFKLLSCRTAPALPHRESH